MKMRSLLISTIMVFSLSASCQELDSATYDFWIGEWTVEWDEGPGKKGTGTNRIERILDGKVLQENFRVLTGQNTGFKGTSISVYDPRRKSWHQAWADNQGGYYDFEGKIVGGRKVFQTKMVDRDGKAFSQRMVFYDITDKGMTWDWESTQDGGETWTLNWRIDYTRVK